MKWKVSFLLAVACTGLLIPGSSFISKAWCQAGSIFDHITTEHGLSSNGVSDIIQDREGFYWMATRNGLNRFDGTNFRAFFSNPNDSISLIHNHCTSLVEDNEGNIWVGTMKGVSCFIKNENLFRNTVFKDPSISPDNVNRIFGLIKDGEGNIWAYGVLLMKYDTKQQQWINYSRQFPPDKGSSYNAEKSVSYDSVHKGVWITSSEGLFFLPEKERTVWNAQNNPLQWKIFSYAGIAWHIKTDTKGRLWFYDYKTQHIVCFSPENNMIKLVMPVTRALQNIRIDDRNRLWLFYWYGPAAVYDENTGIADSRLFEHSYPKSIINSNANNLYIDRDRNYWIASNYGISVLNGQVQYFRYFILDDKPDNTALGQLTITNLVEGAQNNLWLTTIQGLYRYNMEHNSFHRMKDPLLKRPARAIFLDNDTILWIGAGNTVVRYNLNTQITETVCILKSQALFFRKDAENNIWISTWTDGLYCLEASGKIIDHITQDSSRPQSLRSNKLVAFENGYQRGIFWIGYNSGYGYSRFDARKKVSEHFIIRLPQGKENISNIITCIYEEAGGNCWLGSYGGGLYYFDRATNRYNNYLQSDGLYSNFINAVLPDKKGNLWITTSGGLNYVNTTSRQIIPVAIDLELPNNDFIANAFPGKKGKFYFFSGNRIVAVEPSTFNNSTAQTLPLLISSVKIFDKDINFSPLHPQLSLSHKENFFSFEFSLLKTNPDLPVQYACRLQGFDEDWHQVYKRNSVNYTNVPPGNYTFLLKATNQTGQWVYNAVPVKIRITPPFWKTWWFWLIIISAVLISAWLLYRYRINQYKELQEMRNKISRDLHDEIGATLSGIAMYSHLTREKIKIHQVPQVETLVETIQRSATDMVSKLNDIVWVVNPKHDSIEKLVQRLEEFALEMAALKNMEVTVNISQQLATIKLDMQSRKNIYLISKEAINNAIKYSEASHMKLSAILTNHQLQIIIEDNGKGFDINTVKHGNGLYNMTQRAQEIGATCKISSSQGKGTAVFVSYQF